MIVSPEPSLDRALAALLDNRCPDDPRPRRETVDHVLTSGYAEALDLEADRVILQRRLRGAMADDGGVAGERVEELRQTLQTIEHRLAVLRRRLTDLDARFGTD